MVFSHGEAILYWVLMNVKNPNLALADSPPPNTAHVVVSGNPTDGWTSPIGTVLGCRRDRAVRVVALVLRHHVTTTDDTRRVPACRVGHHARRRAPADAV